MCAYARETLTGAIDRDYCERDARRFAQAALIPEELLEREHINTAHAAATLASPPTSSSTRWPPPTSRAKRRLRTLTSNPPRLAAGPSNALRRRRARTVYASPMRSAQPGALLALHE